jgi:hypothetical protein
MCRRKFTRNISTGANLQRRMAPFYALRALLVLGNGTAKICNPLIIGLLRKLCGCTLQEFRFCCRVCLYGVRSSGRGIFQKGPPYPHDSIRLSRGRGFDAYVYENKRLWYDSERIANAPKGNAMVTRCAHVAGVWWATWYIAGGLYAAPACVARTYTIAGDTGLPHVRVTQGLPRIYDCLRSGVAVLYLLFRVRACRRAMAERIVSFVI